MIEKQVSDALVDEGRVEGAALALSLFKPAFTRWSKLLEELDAGTVPASDLRAGPLERFQEGHVLTRIIYKGAYACGILKRHHEEEQILRSLLSQRRWKQGRRGFVQSFVFVNQLSDPISRAWYDRLALILMNYKDKDNAGLEEALQITRDGLQDPATHLSTWRISTEMPDTNLILVYRPALEKRLARLEKKLDVPSEDRYKSLTRLKKSSTILIKGHRAVPKSLQTATSILVSLIDSAGLSNP